MFFSALVTKKKKLARKIASSILLQANENGISKLESWYIIGIDFFPAEVYPFFN